MTSTPAEDRHVFLSYAREDEAKVEQILQALRKKGFPVFIDQDMVAGVDWKKVLENQLQQAYAVVVVWSSRSVKSEWVAREAAVGLEKDRLFPVLVEADIEIPPKFAHLHAADLSGWDGDPESPRFGRAIGLLQPLWEAQMGLLKDLKILKPIRLKPRSVISPNAVDS